MSAEAAILSVIRGERRGAGAAAVRMLLASLAHVYSFGLKLYLLPYRLGVRKQVRLGCPVISVGNLTVGGTGKTPMTIAICKELQARKLTVCVLNRGYKGSAEHGALVVSTETGSVSDARIAGDEAHLLASMLPGISVIAGKDRRVTGRMALERFHPDAIVLDDGMQFYQLHRDLEIVLVDALNPFDNGWTFPRGLLREPPSHLSRANCVVITNVDKVGATAVDGLIQRVKLLAPSAPVFTARYTPVSLRALDRSGNKPVEWLKGRKIASFCALGNPEGFEKQLIDAGAELVHTTRFADHHSPTMGDLNEAIDAACVSSAEAIVVTEKDAVKLPPLGRPLLFLALEVKMQVNDQVGFDDVISRALSK